MSSLRDLSEALAVYFDAQASAAATVAQIIRSGLAAEPEPEAPSVTPQQMRARAVKKDDENLLTQSQVAELLGVCSRTVRRLELEGEIPPPVRVGRAKRWRKNDLRGLVSGHRLSGRAGSK